MAGLRWGLLQEWSRGRFKVGSRSRFRTGSGAGLEQDLEVGLRARFGDKFLVGSRGRFKVRSRSRISAGFTVESRVDLGILWEQV